MLSLVFATAAAAPLLGADPATWAPAPTPVFARMEADVPTHSPTTSSWDLVGAAPREAPLSLTVALSVRNEGRALLEETFWAVSNPKNAKYGAHLNHAEIKKILAVPDAQVERVKSYFMQAGAVEATVSQTNDVLKVRISAI